MRAPLYLRLWHRLVCRLRGHDADDGRIIKTQRYLIQTTRCRRRGCRVLLEHHGEGRLGRAERRRARRAMRRQVTKEAMKTRRRQS
jgi:hypothetical protein